MEVAVCLLVDSLLLGGVPGMAGWGTGRSWVFHVRFAD